jgi:hypothetical protein
MRSGSITEEGKEGWEEGSVRERIPLCFQVFPPHYPTGKGLIVMVSPWPGLRLRSLFART